MSSESSSQGILTVKELWNMKELVFFQGTTESLNGFISSFSIDKTSPEIIFLLPKRDRSMNMQLHQIMCKLQGLAV